MQSESPTIRTNRPEASVQRLGRAKPARFFFVLFPQHFPVRRANLNLK